MAKRPLWPLDAPGMSPPGQDLLDAARALGGVYELEGKGKSKTKRKLTYYSAEVAEIIRRCLYGGGNFTLNMTIKENKRKPMIIVSGHRWGSNPDGCSSGPEPCDVMVIGKMLGDREVNTGRCMRGPTGQHFLHTLRNLGVKNLKHWYVTNVLKTENPDPNSKALKASWISTFDHLLQQEIRLVRPKYILCLGGDAVKAVLGRNMTVGKMNGRVEEIEIDFRKSHDEPENIRKIQVMACEHPATVVREPAKQDKFELDLSRFHKLIQGVRWDQAEEGIDHRVISDEVALRKVIEEAESNNRKKIVAVDAEWHGQHPQNEGAYLRCIQFSWAYKKAACVVLRHVKGKLAFKRIVRRPDGTPVRIGKDYLMTTKGGQQVAIRMLREYLKDKRIVGHFFTSDLEWLVYNKLDLRQQFAAPENFADCKTKGGWDTGLMGHALVEDGLFNLTDQALRYTQAPRYDVALDKWKEKYCRANKLKPSQLEGYGECPDGILYPYACYDADVTRRISLRHAKSLDRDAYGNNCWEPFWISQRAVLPVLEINTEGLPVDRDRLDELTELYMAAKNRLENEITHEFRWPELNLSSTDQIRELLFGTRYNGKRDERGRPVRLRPKRAKSLDALPAITTEKRPREWERIMEEGKEADHTPSTNKTALGILLQESKKMKVWRGGKLVVEDHGREIQMIRNYRFIKQILQSVLRKPVEVEDEDSSDPWEVDENGNYIYSAGLPGYICSDGRVRTSISQVKETGRWSSSRPPLQNLCYDDQTEFLTKRGWVFGENLNPVDEVAQFVLKTRQIEFVRPSALTKQHYRGPMVKFSSNVEDLLVTPNHRCLTQTMSGKLIETEAQSLPLTGRQFVAGRYEGGERRLLLPEVRVLAAIQADGSWTRSGGASFGFRKRRKYDRLVRAFNELGVKFTRQGSSRGDLRLFVSKAEIQKKLSHVIDLLDVKAFSYRIFSLHQDTLRALAEEVFLWDGSTTYGNNYYTSSDKQNLDVVHALFTVVGWRSLQSNSDSKVYCNSRRLDSVQVDGFDRTTESYDGSIYCVTVPSSWIIVRRNGKTAVSGNSKRREPDYKKILGDAYRYPLRSIFCAEPGYMLLEADYVGAELFGAAIMSGDKLMIEHAVRNQLPEHHPEFYDIHSNIAVLAFGYKCEPTKVGLRSIGMEHMRIVAKAVVFGVMYGRGAKAIALGAREEGVTVSVEEAQRVIDTIFLMYPSLLPFFEECRSRAVTRNPEDPAPRWICGPFGRFRRFPITSEDEVMGEFERQAMNFPIQGMIADAVSRAVDHLQTYRDKHKMGFRMVLQVHDALLFMVPYKEVPMLIDEVLPLCMSKMVPIYPCHLDGTPKKDGPYHLGIDAEISHHWGVHMFPDECWDRDVPEKYAGWHKANDFKDGWNCSYFPKDVWLERTRSLHPVVTDKSKQRMLKEEAVQLAVRLKKMARPDDMKVTLKQTKDDELLKLITNEKGVFVAA